MEMPAAALRINQTIRTIVVGVDGSAESMAALRWAGNVVEQDGVIHAVAAVSPAQELVIAAVQIDSAQVITKLTAELEGDWTAPLRSAGHNVVCQVIEEDPANALMQVAATVDADLIVVGVHAKPRHAPRTVGRVTAKLVHHSDRPLAIVDGGLEGPRSASPTVVAHAGRGVATDAAVRWAAAFADTRQTGLTLLRSTPYRPALGPDGLLDVLAFYLDPAMLRQWAAEDLARLADEIQRSTEQHLRITWSAPSGGAGPRLVEASADADLMVIGRDTQAGHGHAMPHEVRHVIIHAPCPVVIIPPDH